LADILRGVSSTRLACACSLALLSNLAAASPQRPAQQRDADLQFLRDLAETRSYTLGQPTSIRPLPDGKTVLFLRAQPRKAELRLFAFDVATGHTRELASPEQILGSRPEQLSPEEKARRERMRITAQGFTSFDLSEDGATMLVTLSGRAFVLPASGGQIREIAPSDSKQGAVLDPKLSPDGKTVSYVRGGELWVAPASGGSAHQLTRGARGAITHAQAEFVAQEEMFRYTGYWWSPDSRCLLFEEADASKVETLFASDPVDPMASPRPMAYPRPGKANVDVKLKLISVKGGRSTPVEWDRSRYPYLVRVVWESGSPLTLVVSTRDQRDLSLAVVDEKTGATRELVHEHDDVFLNINNPYEWLRDGSGFLWGTERSGAWQLELRAVDGSSVRTLTELAFGFRDIKHVDLQNRRVIVTAAPEAVEQHLYAIPLAGGMPKALSEGRGFHSGYYSRDSGTYVLTATSLNSPPRNEVHRADGSVAGELPSVAETPPFVPRVQIAKVGRSTELWTALVRPRDFDPKRKYPVIVNVYGGPHTNLVSPSALAYMRDQWIADHGYIVARVDGRGTPRRGRNWERAIFGKFSEVPLEDQVIGLQALGESEGAHYLKRVGIMGHSFGGYMAALSVMRRPEVYKAAVASAPVVDWLDYDTTYTERYLGVPDTNTSVYEANGLLRYAFELSRPLLIIHGTADDNVHFNQALKLADALFRAGKTFELLTLAGQTHLLYEPDLTYRYWQRVFGFFSKNL